MIYKERDEQLKAILSLANRQISHSSSEPVATPTTEVPPFEKPLMTPVVETFEEADVLEEEEVDNSK